MDTSSEQSGSIVIDIETSKLMNQWTNHIYMGSNLCNEIILDGSYQDGVEINRTYQQSIVDANVLLNKYNTASIDMTMFTIINWGDHFVNSEKRQKSIRKRRRYNDRRMYISMIEEWCSVKFPKGL